jgi:hypothetical protein
MNDTCALLAARPIPPYSIISNYTAGDVEKLRHIRLHETFAPGEMVDEPVVPAFELHKAWFETLVRLKLPDRCSPY